MDEELIGKRCVLTEMCDGMDPGTECIPVCCGPRLGEMAIIIPSPEWAQNKIRQRASYDRAWNFEFCLVAEAVAAAASFLGRPVGKGDRGWWVSLTSLSLAPDPVAKAEPVMKADDGHYPHACPHCGGRAYVSIFGNVDCQKRCGGP